MRDERSLSRRQIADRYLLPPLAAFVGLTLRLSPWKRQTRALAAWLVVQQTPRPSDVIVVLGGGSIARARTGARLYARGLAPVVYLSTDIEPWELAGSGASSSFDVLRQAGVPPEAIRHDRQPGTTGDEARLFVACARRDGWHSALIVTDPYHTRRAQRVFARAVEQSGGGITLTIVSTSDGATADWWESRQACVAVLGEYAALLVHFLTSLRHATGH